MAPVQKLVFVALVMLAAPMVAACTPDTPATALNWDVNDAPGHRYNAPHVAGGRTIYADAGTSSGTRAGKPQTSRTQTARARAAASRAPLTMAARDTAPRTYVYQENLAPLPTPGHADRSTVSYAPARQPDSEVDPALQDYTWNDVPGYRRQHREAELSHDQPRYTARETDRPRYRQTSYTTPSREPSPETENPPADNPPADKPAPAPVYRDGAVAFGWPVSGDVISGFGGIASGGKNDGINIAVPAGTPIHAAASGTVTYAGNELKGYGNLLLLKHAGGFTTAYAHADRLLVSRGEFVAKGQIIGYAGQTGDVTRPQLHFEIRANTTPVNPRSYLPGRNS